MRESERVRERERERERERVVFVPHVYKVVKRCVF